MDPTHLIHIVLDGRRIPVHIRRRASEPSRHTGRELVELHGWSTTADLETSRWLTAALRGLGDRGVGTADAAGEFSGRWQVSWNSYAENAGVHTYTLILREHEELTLEALEVAGEELHPYEYREELVGEGIFICAKVVAGEEDVARLRERMRAETPFPVIRRGIQDQPRPMRLGVGEWSPYEEGRVKVRLTLLDAGLQNVDPATLARVERENSHAALAFYTQLTERLTELLVERGVLTPAELDALREAAAAAPAAPRHDLWRAAADIDVI